MKKVLFIILSIYILCSCSKDFSIPKVIPQDYMTSEYDINHTWRTTTKCEVSIDLGNYVKAQVLSLISNGTDEPYLVVLNETHESGKLYYDCPDNNLGIFVVYSDREGNLVFNGKNSISHKIKRRSDFQLLDEELFIEGKVKSYANLRNWVPGEYLYYSSIPSISVNNYSEEVCEVLRMVIFSHFKNGRQYNNMEVIRKDGNYNENSYPITTNGGDPILVSPIYKNDGTSKEVENCELYYYYFPESVTDLDIIKNLPKYRAITLSNSIRGNEVLEKFCSYGLVYWGDGIPEEGAKGTYIFPPGYKIGFMLRNNLVKGNGVMQGELYCDGRLNTKINKYGNFKTSGLSADDPRMAWLTVNGKNLLCCESGTDKDFNDLIFEVEGGVLVPKVIPEFEANYYTFCFEDNKIGDYDLNDIVISGRRLNDTSVEYRLMACGANDNLYLKGINGKRIKEDQEVHNIFGRFGFINTENLDTPFIIDTIHVSKEFSFLDEPFYLWNDSKKYSIHISRVGEDPHAIMIPARFYWSKEKISIKESYPFFGNWGRNRVESTDWYLYPDEDKVIK